VNQDARRASGELTWLRPPTRFAQIGGPSRLPQDDRLPTSPQKSERPAVGVAAQAFQGGLSGVLVAAAAGRGKARDFAPFAPQVSQFIVLRWFASTAQNATSLRRWAASLYVCAATLFRQVGHAGFGIDRIRQRRASDPRRRLGIAHRWRRSAVNFRLRRLEGGHQYSPSPPCTWLDLRKKTRAHE
jgi:hypothetical protein